MKKAKKISIISALGLITAGIIVSVCAISVYGTNPMTYQSSTNYEKKSQNFEKDSFDTIEIHTIDDDVEVKLSTDGKIHLDYVESDHFCYEIDPSSRRLFIKQEQSPQEWYKKFYYNQFVSKKVTLYLAEEDYDQFYVGTENGDITVNLNLKVNSEFCLQSTNGDISVSDLTVTGKSAFEEDLDFSGAVDIMNTNGDIILNKVKAPCVNLNTSGGDITIDYVRADKVDIFSSMGDITGITDMPYIYEIENAEGSYGDHELPISRTGGGKMILTSILGDIIIEEK